MRWCRSTTVLSIRAAAVVLPRAGRKTPKADASPTVASLLSSPVAATPAHVPYPVHSTPQTFPLWRWHNAAAETRALQRRTVPPISRHQLCLFARYSPRHVLALPAYRPPLFLGLVDLQLWRHASLSAVFEASAFERHAQDGRNLYCQHRVPRYCSVVGAAHTGRVSFKDCSDRYSETNIAS